MGYIQKQKRGFDELPLGVLDILAFAWFTYGDYAPLTLPFPLPQIAYLPYYKKEDAFEESFMPDKSVIFVRSMARCPRYKDVELLEYEAAKDREKAVQFSAMAFRIDGRILIAYEGTDPSYEGWKEDFMMSYSDEIASYSLALKFFNRVHAKYREPIILAGHSKGGNIATYVLAKAKSVERIEGAYSFEGPGFHEKDIFAGKKARLAKHHKYVPQCSIVGIVFEDEAKMNIIRSTGFGVLQHNPFSWVIKDDDFVYLKKRTLTSKYVDRAFNGWVNGLSDEEKKRFSDILFRALGKMDVTNFTRFFKSFLGQIGPLFHQYRILDESDKKFFQFVLKRLGKSAVKAFTKEEPPRLGIEEKKA